MSDTLTDEEIAEATLPEPAERGQTNYGDGGMVEAPHGRKADGTPRKRPGPQPGTGGRPRKSVPAPARKRSGTVRKASGPDYRAGIIGLGQIVSFPLAVAARYQKTEQGQPAALALDAAAVNIHIPNIAEALNSIAQERPEVAAVLDRILSAGPYGLLIGALVPLVAQIGVNHGKLPDTVGKGLGAMSRDELVAALASQAATSDAG